MLWEKGEIAHFEQFLLFPQCFQKTYTAEKPVLIWERVKIATNVYKKKFAASLFLYEMHNYSVIFRVKIPVSQKGKLIIHVYQ